MLVIVYLVLSTLERYMEPMTKEPPTRSREKSIRKYILERKKFGVEVRISRLSV